MKIKKELALLAVSITLSLIIFEFGLRAFANFPVPNIRSISVDHPVLGHTASPLALSDVDASGFRNPSDKGLHQIVAIGDSHTFGNNAGWEEAWPYQLGRAVNKTVYNYGLWGYGIFHYLYLAQEALPHKPEYVLLGFYPVNDLQPATCNAVSPGYYQELLKSGIAELECAVKPVMVMKKIKDMLAENSALFSALELFRRKYLEPVIAQVLYNGAYFDFNGLLISKGRVFQHNKETDLSRKAVKANYNASKKILPLISNELRANGILFGVVIIPSKELVVEQWAINSGIDIPEKFTVKPEKNLIDNYLAFLNEKNIPAIDATTYIVEAFAKSAELKEAFYPFGDSHPLAKGYESYSRAAAKLISTINQNEIKTAGGDPEPLAPSGDNKNKAGFTSKL